MDSEGMLELGECTNDRVGDNRADKLYKTAVCLFWKDGSGGGRVDGLGLRLQASAFLGCRNPEFRV
jgi:hypothetical protein